MNNIAIFASGRGSNAEALLNFEENCSGISIQCLMTDQPEAGVIEIAHKYNKPIYIIPRGDLSRKEHEEKIYNALSSIDWIFLAGYMRILSSHFINYFFDKNLNQSRIVNIHPSLLPHYPGLDAYERAYEDNVPTSGITVHFVDSGIDTGKIIKQKSFKRSEEMSIADFIKAGLQIEHQIYPAVMQELGIKGIL